MPRCSAWRVSTSGASRGRRNVHNAPAYRPELWSARTGRPGAVCCIRRVYAFSVATNEYVGKGREKAEYHAVITWERLADICAQYLGRGSMVAIEGRLQTRQWDDEAGKGPCQVRRRV